MLFILPNWHVLKFFAGLKTFSIFLNSFQLYCIKYFDNYSVGLIDKFRFKQGAARIIVLHVLQKPVQLANSQLQLVDEVYSRRWKYVFCAKREVLLAQLKLPTDTC